MQAATARSRLVAAVPRTIIWIFLLAVSISLTGCRSFPVAPDRSTVAVQLGERFGETIPCHTCPAEIIFPPGAALEDGITEDEAVAIALWNNAAFQELLADLGMARGDLIQAGLLPNPEFVYFFPMSEKPFKYLFEIPLEAIWLRPIRVNAAASEADRTTKRLAQAGLDLMRDVRQAYADAVLAHERVHVARESVKLRGRIAKLAEIRLQAGDISPQESATARIDSLRAEQDASRVAYDVPVMEERLRNLMGISSLREALVLDPSPPHFAEEMDVDVLAQEAISMRPDALAATEAITAAAARLEFAKLGWVRFLGIADATSGKESHVLGPALRVTLPLFNRNQGAIARAEAELERAVRNQHTVSNQILLDVYRAYFQYQQTCAEYEILRSQVRPEVEEAVRQAQGGYREGNVPFFIVLESTRQLLDNYLREVQLQGDVRRFLAELERSVGRRLPEAIQPASDAPPTIPGVHIDTVPEEIPAPSNVGEVRLQ